jgi:hypothetical protein
MRVRMIIITPPDENENDCHFPESDVRSGLPNRTNDFIDEVHVDM